MLSRFLSVHPVSDGLPVPGLGWSGLDGLLREAGGRAYSGGLYRIHSPDSARAATALVVEAFPEFAHRVSCFGYDWLGRQFSLDATRGQGNDPEVLMFEPGTGEALEIPVPFSRFHDEELVDYADAALAVNFFDKWRRAGGQSPDFNECVGYRTPLFLGGDDEVANLEISDLEVYWTLFGQLRLGVARRGQPD